MALIKTRTRLQKVTYVLLAIAVAALVVWLVLITPVARVLD